MTATHAGQPKKEANAHWGRQNAQRDTEGATSSERETTGERAPEKVKEVGEGVRERGEEDREYEGGEVERRNREQEIEKWRNRDSLRQGKKKETGRGTE